MWMCKTPKREVCFLGICLYFFLRCHHHSISICVFINIPCVNIIRAPEDRETLPSSLRHVTSPSSSSKFAAVSSSKEEALRAAAVFIGQEGGQEESSTLWVSNLDETVTEEELRRLFQSKCTGLTDVRTLHHHHQP